MASNVPIDGLPPAVWATLQAEAEARDLDPAGLIELLLFTWQCLSPLSRDMLEDTCLIIGANRVARLILASPAPPSRN